MIFADLLRRPPKELIRGVIPFVIRRFLPDTTYEDWKVLGGGLEEAEWGHLGPTGSLVVVST